MLMGLRDAVFMIIKYFQLMYTWEFFFLSKFKFLERPNTRLSGVPAHFLCGNNLHSFPKGLVMWSSETSLSWGRYWPPPPQRSLSLQLLQEKEHWRPSVLSHNFKAPTEASPQQDLLPESRCFLYWCFWGAHSRSRASEGPRDSGL